jgi:hypothetical protein
MQNGWASSAAATRSRPGHARPPRSWSRDLGCCGPGGGCGPRSAAAVLVRPARRRLLGRGSGLGSAGAVLVWPARRRRPGRGSGPGSGAAVLVWPARRRPRRPGRGPRPGSAGGGPWSAEPRRRLGSSGRSGFGLVVCRSYKCGVVIADGERVQDPGDGVPAGSWWRDECAGAGVPGGVVGSFLCGGEPRLWCGAHWAASVW